MDDGCDRSSVAESVAYLQTPEARASLARDPYWPKWNSPWWHVLALEEAGATDAIPADIAEALMKSASSFYLPFFPTRASEMPAGEDWYRRVICHCGLGSLLRVLLACGLDVEDGIPWSKGWFVRYQLPDGGFNCDEKAYTRDQPKSSIVSTLPPLEYLLALNDRRPLAAEEISVLDHGAAYLLRHRLVCSARSGHVLRQDWLEPSLPRFYEYDALRGLAFLVRWAELFQRRLPIGEIDLALQALEHRFEHDPRPPLRRWHSDQRTRVEAASGEETWGPASSFALLDALVEPAAAAQVLGKQWLDVQQALGRLREPRDGSSGSPSQR